MRIASSFNWLNSSRRRVILVLVVAVSLAGSAFAIYRLTRTTLPPLSPPEIELTGADPIVTKVITAARAAVESDPGSGAAWGRLGMVLLAHDYYTEGLICFSRAEQLNPSDSRWSYFQGLILMREKP